MLNVVSTILSVAIIILVTIYFIVNIKTFIQNTYEEIDSIESRMCFCKIFCGIYILKIIIYIIQRSDLLFIDTVCLFVWALNIVLNYFCLKQALYSAFHIVLGPYMDDNNIAESERLEEGRKTEK